MVTSYMSFIGYRQHGAVGRPRQPSYIPLRTLSSLIHGKRPPRPVGIHIEYMNKAVRPSDRENLITGMPGQAERVSGYDQTV